MPHVIVEGPASVERFYQEFVPIDIQDGEALIKVREVYLGTDKNHALLNCIVIEDRIAHKFYAILAQKASGITVRLDPLTDPEKTDGVKRLLARIGHVLKSQDPVCRYGKHNLTGFLIED